MSSSAYVQVVQCLLGAPWGFGLLGYTLAAGVSPHEACGTEYASIYTRTVHTLFLRTVCCGRVHRELPSNCCMSADGTLAVASRLGQRQIPLARASISHFPARALWACAWRRTPRSCSAQCTCLQNPKPIATRLREQNLRNVCGADDGCEQRTRWLA